MPQRISHEMVPARSAHSSAVISSSPWRPRRTTSSPGATSVVAAVDHQHVHGDHPGQGIAPSVDQDLGPGVEEPTGIAVGVAEGDRGDGGGAFQRPSSSVARSLADLDATNGDDVGAKRQGRHQALAGLFAAPTPATPRAGSRRARDRREPSCSRASGYPSAPALFAACTMRGATPRSSEVQRPPRRSARSGPE